MRNILLSLLFCLSAPTLFAQIDEDQSGAWYMYFYNAKFDDGPWGIQGDFQYRNWDALGDLEQLLLRSGLTYTPKDVNALFTMGLAHITTGAFGDSDATTAEHRIYQEALLPHRVHARVHLVHRFRYEQRWVDNQDFRTRFRYNLFMNIPFNKDHLGEGAIYAAFYNEIFINGERGIGNNRRIGYFDRNRTYLALGYSLSNQMRVQVGWMQQTTENWQKGQLQVGLIHNFKL